MRNNRASFLWLRLPCAALLVAGVLGGCATTNQSRGLNEQGIDEAAIFAADKPAQLKPFYRKLYREGEWNAVLNFNQLGLAAMNIGQFDVARRAFDQSIARISTIYADDPNAKKALSVFSAEKVKDFKGEPYERAMAYFYRGVLYAQQGDYQNSRASFLAADLQGSLGEKENYDNDFGLMKYAAGWASICEGDGPRGKTLVAEAKRSDSKIAALPDLPERSLLLIDTGLAPRKIGVGDHKEAVGFEPGGPADGDIVVSGRNGVLQIKEWLVGGDVYVQASTRGGRPIDAILDGKARFKDGADTTGNVALVIGMAMIDSGDTAVMAAGAVVALLGLVAKGVSEAAAPAADTRQWSSLPASVLLFTGDVEPGPGITMVSAVSPTPTLLPVQQRNGGCWIGWGRTRSALATADGGYAELADTKIEYADRDAKNSAFRSNSKPNSRAVRASQLPTPTPKRELSVLQNRNQKVCSYALVVALLAATATTGCAQQPAAPYVPGAPPIVVECATPYEGARPEPALVGEQYGMQMSMLPLNSVQFDNHGTASRLAIQRIFSSRTATDTVEVTARFVSCSDYPVVVRVRTSFLRANEAPAEPTSAWRQVYLSPRAIAHYTEYSVARDANSYVIEIAAGQ